MNRAINVIGTSGCEWANANARAAQRQILYSGRASRSCRSLGRAIPLPVVQNVIRRLILNNLQGGTLAQGDAGLLKVG